MCLLTVENEMDPNYNPKRLNGNLDHDVGMQGKKKKKMVDPLLYVVSNQNHLCIEDVIIAPWSRTMFMVESLGKNKIKVDCAGGGGSWMSLGEQNIKENNKAHDWQLFMVILNIKWVEF